MKKINIHTIIGITVILTMSDCSKDKGNYEYQDINMLTILDEQGQDMAGQDYDIRLGRELHLQPKVTGTLSLEDHSQLHYYWIIDEDTVSQEQQLLVDTDVLGVGNKVGKLVIVDNQTTLSYSVNFRIRIVAGISKGSFIMTENEQHESTVVLRDLNAVADYTYLKQFNGIELGKYPINLDIAYSASSSTNREYVRLISTTAEGINPVMVTDLKTFLPSLLYPADGARLDGQVLTPGFTWNNPRSLQTNNVDGLVLSGGKCMVMASGLIGEDVYRYDPLDYDFGENAIAPSLVLSGHFLAGFDQKNERIRVFGNNLKGGNVYTVNYDHRVDPEKTKGHQFVAATEIFTTELKWQFITRKGSEIFMHNAVMDINNYPYSLKELYTLTSRTVPQMVDAVHFVFAGSYWYFAKGRTIYQCSSNGLDIAPYLTLPEDGSGDIVAWNFNADAAGTYTKIGIATYNSSTSESYKGSYYLYNMNSKNYDQKDIHVIDKAVDIEIGL